MSTQLGVRFSCDWSATDDANDPRWLDSCGTTTYVSTWRSDIAEEQARIRGWVIEGNRSLCPEHA